MKNPHDLKQLQTRRAQLEAEARSLSDQVISAQAQLSQKKNELVAIRQKITAFSAQEPAVSEHALLRYVERVKGIDLGEIQAEILNEKNRQLIDFAGTAACRIKAGGVELVVKNRTVISVVA